MRRKRKNLEVKFSSERVENIYRKVIKALIGAKKLDRNEKIELLNAIRWKLHKISPFRSEPVDCVLWVRNENVEANDYNPNKVAPPEMKLLEWSIIKDGYTQPIVSWRRDRDTFEVVDGFHRNRVGRESLVVKNRLGGYLPITVINPNRVDRSDRISSTIRHNRARGKHVVEGMSEIVIELKRRNWTNQRIAKELGMEQDEILRLCQISGLRELFEDEEFSEAWDVDGDIDDFVELDDDINEYGEEVNEFRTVNTSDESRIFHTYDKWECFKAGFYATSVEGKSRRECEEIYRDFLLDEERFRKALEHVITEWKHSCEHYLTNKAMNRIAWLGQAAVCYAEGIPSKFRNGFNLLTKEQQEKANRIALEALNEWNKMNGRSLDTMDTAMPNRESDIY